jgi:hypothetical protein
MFRLLSIVHVTHTLLSVTGNKEWVRGEVFFKGLVEWLKHKAQSSNPSSALSPPPPPLKKNLGSMKKATERKGM